MLIFYSLLSFGIHFSRSAFSVYILSFIYDGFVTPGDYSILITSSFIPSLFVPVFAGHWLDSASSAVSRAKYTNFFIFITLIGQILLCYAIDIRVFPLAVLAQVIFGSGACCLIAAQRTIIIEEFKVIHIILLLETQIFIIFIGIRNVCDGVLRILSESVQDARPDIRCPNSCMCLLSFMISLTDDHSMFLGPMSLHYI